jgi:histidyl-tRNA synthetase
MSAKRIQPRLLKGFRDYLPEEMIPRQKMINTISDVFQRHGFAPMSTPILEYAEILLGKGGTEADKLYYRFQDHGERDVCMRYELTISHARVVAQYGEIARPLKIYQIGPVWRGENTGHGRYREFYQCDVDILGAKGALAEYECIQIDYDVLTALGINDFQIHLSERRLLNGLVTMLGLDDPTRMKPLARTIDKLMSQGEETVRRLLVEEAKLTPDQVEKVFEYLTTSGTNDEILAKLRTFFDGVPEAIEGVENLEHILTLAKAGGIADGALAIDLSIVRGLDYYTGTVYETFLTDMPSLGSVMSGGRYDGLVEMFTGQPTPAVGISVGIDRLLAGLQKMGRVQPMPSVTEVLVTVFGAETSSVSVEAATGLRAAGVCAELSVLDKGGFGKQLKYANKQGIPWTLMIGPDEAEAGTMTLRNMTSGDQHTCTSVGDVAKIAHAE